MKEEELCSQLFCGKAIHWVIGWCQRWRLYGNNFWYCSCYPEGFHLVSFKFANEHFLNCFMSYSLRIRIKNRQRRDFPSGPWLRIFLPVQWTWVWSLVQELRSHMPWGPSTTTTEPTWCTYQSLCALEPLLCKKRRQQNQKQDHYNSRVALAHCNKRRPTQQGRARVCQRRPSRVKDK